MLLERRCIHAKGVLFVCFLLVGLCLDTSGSVVVERQKVQPESREGLSAHPRDKAIAVRIKILGCEIGRRGGETVCKTSEQADLRCGFSGLQRGAAYEIVVNIVSDGDLVHSWTHVWWRDSLIHHMDQGVLMRVPALVAGHYSVSVSVYDALSPHPLNLDDTADLLASGTTPFTLLSTVDVAHAVPHPLHPSAHGRGESDADADGEAPQVETFMLGEANACKKQCASGGDGLGVEEGCTPAPAPSAHAQQPDGTGKVGGWERGGVGI